MHLSPCCGRRRNILRARSNGLVRKITIERLEGQAGYLHHYQEKHMVGRLCTRGHQLPKQSGECNRGRAYWVKMVILTDYIEAGSTELSELGLEGSEL